VIRSLTDLTGNYGFTNLDPNTSYVIKVVYTYNFGDSLGDQSFTVTRSFTTIARENVPSVSMDDVETNDTSISFGLLITDIEEVGAITAIELYDSNNLLADTIDTFNGDYAFTGLTAYTSYRLVVTYTYNFGDSLGNQTFILTYNFKTTPTVEISEISKSANNVQVNDDLLLKFDIDNELQVKITEVLVNGVWYRYSFLTYGTGRITIRILSDLPLGDYVFTIEAIRMTLESTNENFELYFKDQTDIAVYINGDLLIDELTMLDNSGALIYYALMYQTIQVEVKIDNPSNHTIQQVTYFTTNIGNRVIDKDFIIMAQDMQSFILIVQVPYFYSWNQDLQVSILNISYSNSKLVERTKSFNNAWTYVTLLNSSEVIYITNAAQLQAMANNSGRYYKLANDIDLTGFDWTPIANFRGIFDGQGHTIKNLTIVKTYSNMSASVGLFDTIGSTSIIKNLNIVNASVSTTFTTDNNTNMYPNVGLLAGVISNRVTIENIQIQGDLSVLNSTNSWSETNLGLLAGYSSSESTYRNIQIKGFMEAEVYSGYVNGGGLIGKSSGKIQVSLIMVSFDGLLVNEQQNTRGGGEYMSVQNAWSITEASVNYFTNYYGLNAKEAFVSRTTDSIKSEFCKL
jgi:hypothetical protein